MCDFSLCVTRIMKHTIVTGGANGIGRAIALAFLREGGSVTIIDIDDNAGNALAKEQENLRFFHGDIGEKKVLDDFVTAVTLPVDCLVNNACVSRRGILSGCTYKDFEYVQRVGVTAPYYLTEQLVKQGLLAQGASVINIASTRAEQSQADSESYTAAKGGIVSLTHGLAVSLAGRARVNCISPGWIDVTDGEFSRPDHAQHPAGRVGVPTDIAEMVLYLSGEKAEFITGQNITIDGGMGKLMIYHGDNGWNLS